MKYVNVCSVILVNPKHVYIYKKTGKNTGMKQQNWIEQCKINMIKSKRKIEKIRLPFCLPKRSAKGGDKSQREERRANPTSMVLFIQLLHLNIYFFILPQRFLSLPLRLSLFSDTKQATQNCHHHTNLICHHHYYFT